MLNEVRKEAFSLRKTKSTTSNEEEEEEDNEENISPTEEWTSSYPQKWIGWVMYGVPSENQTEHWVKQPSSSGPTDVEHYVDDNGMRSSKNPPGRRIMYNHKISHVLK